MDWTTDEPSFDSRQGPEILFPRQSTAVLDPSQPSSQRVPGCGGGEAPFPGGRGGRSVITAMWYHDEEYTELYHHTPYAFIALFLITRTDNISYFIPLLQRFEQKFVSI